MNRAKDKASWQADNSRLILATMKQRQERTKEEEEEEKKKKKKEKDRWQLLHVNVLLTPSRELATYRCPEMTSR